MISTVTRDGNPHRAPRAERATPAEPVPGTAFRTRDGNIGHARCGWMLAFQGRRAGIELDFYCPCCVEHVTLPDCILPRIPYGEPVMAEADDAHHRD